MQHVAPLALVLVALLFLAFGVRAHLIAENIFLRQQILLFQARGKRPKRPSAFARLVLALTSRLFDCKSAPFVFKLETLIRWQKDAFRQFWKAKSAQPGRPRIPQETVHLIRQMQIENFTWGARRIANELNLKLGIQLSHRTVAKYMRPRKPRGSSLTWKIFLLGPKFPDPGSAPGRNTRPGRTKEDTSRNPSQFEGYSRRITP